MAIQDSPSRAARGSNRDAADRFQPADEAVRRRLICSICAREKEGKTHFGLTAPGPIGVINIDIGLEGVIQKFIAEKQIVVSNVKLDIPKDANLDKTSEIAKEVWDRVVEDIDYSLGNHRTCLVDTGTEAWELLRLAEFGKLEQVKPHHYARPNGMFRTVYRRAYDSNCNFITLHKMKKEYVNDKTTGNFERSGFSDTGFMVQVEALAYRIGPQSGKGIRDCEWDDNYFGEDDLGFRLKITDCRQNPGVVGTVLAGPLLNFVGLATTVFPDSDPEEWT